MVLKDFYTVSGSEENENIYTTSLKVNGTHEIYKGHFPNRPVTPGVVLMQLFKDEAERVFDKKLALQRADNVKFTAVFDPTEDPELILESDLQENGEFIKLKGIARNVKGIVLKINALYKIL